MYVVPPQSQGSTGSDDRRIYQSWKGSNFFFLKGRLIFGPDVRSLGLTICLLVVPVVIFCVFVARKLMDVYSYHLGILIMVAVVVYTIGVLVLLLLTSARDPGIIPRNAHPPEPEGYDGQTPQLRLPRVKEIQLNGITVKIKYCDTCMLYRPPRCSHCSICNNCVERFDHHCPWVGQCVGLRNYRFFFMFVFSTALLCIYVFAFCWVYIKRIMHGEDITIWKAMIKTPASIVLIIYTFISIWFVGGLTAFHLYLIGTNQTTYENFRYRYDLRANPYHKGVIGNFKEIFCTSISPSKNNFRAKAEEETALSSRPVADGGFMSPNTGKVVDDIEMGRKGVSNDDTVGIGDDDHFEELNNVKDRGEVMFPEIRTNVEDDTSEHDGIHHPRRSSWENVI